MNDTISAALSLAPLALAQTPAIGATEIGQWLLAGAAVAVIANQGLAFFRNITGGFARKQTPRAEGIPDIEFCDKRHGKIESRLDNLENTVMQKVETIHTTVTQKVGMVEATVAQKVDSLRSEMKSDMKGVHSRVDDVMKGVARIEGKIL